ncbi:hypothetical protein [Azospirillum sp.]|uniref:hypothetical protein n=1 Tax=Azospirillum sp. TaxID=34012 RepID=UPI002D65966F|nr:hypothetical protein [Azospirillum sp.]HYD68272.1 hypothetical protein [Azospirillum sp.]
MSDIELAKEIVAVVAPALPLLQGVGDGILQQTGAKITDATLSLAKALWAKLGPRVADNPAAQAAAQEVTSNPDDEDTRAAFRLQVRKLLEADPQLAKDLQALLGQGNVVASGQGAVAIGGSVTGSVIVTGSGNIVGR